jgi:hypothetical protein
MENKSHATEIMQKTRIELENGDISGQEIDDSIRVSYSSHSSWCVTLLLLEGSPGSHSCLSFNSGIPIPPQSIRMHGGWTRQCLVESMGMDHGRRQFMDATEAITSPLELLEIISISD